MMGVNRSMAAVVLMAAASLFLAPATLVLAAQSDLDAFMQQVVARRDDNWKKLQQYILDEREQIEVRGPAHVSLWGERREFTWYIRDGFFVRSPVKVNGVAIGEADRRKYEADYLQRVQKRDQRRADLARSAARKVSSSGPQSVDTPLEICPFEGRDELHVRHVLPRQTVVVGDEQIDASYRRTRELDRVGGLDGAVGANRRIARRAGPIKRKNRGDLPNRRFMIANGCFALFPRLDQ